jgi:hypothetical protein
MVDHIFPNEEWKAIVDSAADAAAASAKVISSPKIPHFGLLNFLVQISHRVICASDTAIVTRAKEAAQLEADEADKLKLVKECKAVRIQRLKEMVLHLLPLDSRFTS